MVHSKHTRLRVAVGVAALALGLSVAREGSAQVLPHEPTVDRLPNGLTVVTVPYDAPGIVA